MFSFISNLSNFVPGMSGSPDPSRGNGSSDSQSMFDNVPWTPSSDDVIAVKVLLGVTFHLPIELVDDIIDEAEYWPHSTARIPEVPNSPPITLTSRDANRIIIRCPPLGLYKSQYDLDPLSRPLPLEQPFDHDDIRQWFRAYRSRPPRLLHPCRKIVFRIRSHDQGWGGSGYTAERPFTGSYTWFDAGIERFDKAAVERTVQPQARNCPPPPSCLRSVSPAIRPAQPDDTNSYDGLAYDISLLPDEHRIQSNRTASRAFEDHVITWSWTDDLVDDQDSPFFSTELDALEVQGRGRATADGAFVRNLQLGDVVTLWAKARFPGWINTIEVAEVEVYWAM